MKLLSLFSGIGAFEKALDNLEIPYELVAYCEIDKYASKSYSAIHNVPESMNLGDITKVDEKQLPKDIDLVTYGFPCQDISLAGKQKGLFNEDGSQTRSGLFFEALRIIEETQPRVAIAENVKNLVGKKFKEQFKIVLDSLEQAGYNNYYKVLNSRNFGIPQNRERVFIISIRKDIDTGFFQFPEGFPLEKRLKDVLEDEVDEKYYISNKGVEGLIKAMTDGRGHKPNIMNDETEYCSTLDTRVGDQTHRSPYIEEQPLLIGVMQKNQAIKTDGICTTLTGSMGTGGGYVPMVTEPTVKQIGNCCPTKTRDNPNQGRVYDQDGLSPSLNCMEGGNRQPCVMVKTNNSKGYDIAEPGDYINIERPGSTTRRGRVGHGVSQCLDTKENHCVVVENESQLPGAYGRNFGSKGKLQETDGVCETLLSAMGTGGGNVPIIEEPFIVASRGRNPENPSDRTVGSPTEQRLEPNSQGICNTLTTVQKDNLVCEPPELRIRKLTPKECFRLQGFDDESFHRAESVNSNTQLYKQAGNSITVQVVEALMKSLIEAQIFNKEN